MRYRIKFLIGPIIGIFSSLLITLAVILALFTIPIKEAEILSRGYDWSYFYPIDDSGPVYLNSYIALLFGIFGLFGAFLGFLKNREIFGGIILIITGIISIIFIYNPIINVGYTHIVNDIRIPYYFSGNLIGFERYFILISGLLILIFGIPELVQKLRKGEIKISIKKIIYRLLYLCICIPGLIIVIIIVQETGAFITLILYFGIIIMGYISWFIILPMNRKRRLERKLSQKVEQVDIDKETTQKQLKMAQLSKIGLTLFLGPLLVWIIQIFGIFPSLLYIFFIGPVTMVIGLILFIIGYYIRKKLE